LDNFDIICFFGKKKKKKRKIKKFYKKSKIKNTKVVLFPELEEKKNEEWI
jgi:hypothetical protein